MRELLRPRSFPITGSDVSQGDLREHQTAYTPPSKRDLKELYKKHAQEVWAMVYAHLLNAEEAHDIKHETFFRLLNELERGKKILRPRAWLMRVGRNLAEDYRKKPAVRRRSKEFDPEDLDNIGSNVVSPLEFLCRCEQNTALKDALAELDTKLRIPLVLYYFEGMHQNEISKATGVSPSTVCRRIDRALLQLKERLAHWDDNNRPGLACAS